MKAIHLYCFVPPNLVVCVSNQKLARASAMVSAPNGVILGTIYLCGAIKTIRWTLQTVIRNKTMTLPKNRLARLDEIRLSLSNAENDQILPSFFPSVKLMTFSHHLCNAYNRNHLINFRNHTMVLLSSLNSFERKCKTQSY